MDVEMKQQPIPRELDRLSSRIDSLTEAVQTLEGRLSPVMKSSPSEMERALPQRDPNPGASNMTIHLEDFGEAISRLEQKVREITDQLEV